MNREPVMKTLIAVALFVSSAEARAGYCQVLLGNTVSAAAAERAVEAFKVTLSERPFAKSVKAGSGGDGSHFIRVEVSELNEAILSAQPSHINGVPVHYFVSAANVRTKSTLEQASAAWVELNQMKKDGNFTETTDFIFSKDMEGSYYIEAYVDFGSKVRSEQFPPSIEGVRVEYIGNRAELAGLRKEMEKGFSILNRISDLYAEYPELSRLSLDRDAGGNYFVAVGLRGPVKDLKKLPMAPDGVRIFYYFAESVKPESSISQTLAKDAVLLFKERTKSESVVSVKVEQDYDGSYFLAAEVKAGTPEGFFGLPARVSGVPVLYGLTRAD